ncbi:MAG: FHA domain-containing protein, partial [Anaerolineae bacterium]|nr:FHA domain-containing protein [Anaerolineae bacterium]
GEDYPWERLIEGLNHIKENSRSTDTLTSPPPLPELRTARMNAPGAWIIVKRGPQPEQLWNLNKEIITLGREITNDIVINDQQVSRRHARFVRQNKGPFASFALEDLHSSNGTFINEQRLTGTQLLDDGDLIDLGETITLIYKLITD